MKSELNSFNAEVYSPINSCKIPDFLRIQRSSFRHFLQSGLITEFNKYNPITNSDKSIEIFFYADHYKLNQPKWTPKQAILKRKSYACQLYIPVQLINHKTEQTFFQWMVLANLPLMTKHGHFILNGSPRVLMNQMIRSPGVYFKKMVNENKKSLCCADFIAERGAWLRIEVDTKKGDIWVKLKKTPKIPLFVFLKALGLTIPVLNSFIDMIKLRYILQLRKESEGKTNLSMRPFLNEPLDFPKLKSLLKSLRLILDAKIEKKRCTQKKKNKKLRKKGFPEKELPPRISRVGEAFLTISSSGLLELTKYLYPKKTYLEFPIKQAQKFLFRKFLNNRTYDLSILGRSRINKKLGIAIPVEHTTLTAQDVLFATLFLLDLLQGFRTSDDIDDLKNRKIKASGELIQIQLATGLLNLDKMIGEKLKQPLGMSRDFKLESLITVKPLNQSFREFFGTNPLSQLMDQTNPLAEITHKRRLSSLGPGGINRETAGMLIRGIHPTHYGRICPIETPEGQNAGLVNSITTYANLNPQGFLETPFYKTYKGFILKTQDPLLFSSDQERAWVLAPGDINVSKLHFLPPNIDLPARYLKEFKRIARNNIHFIALSPIQMISVATSLIPFLEHDDGNRALMGSNMQRQAVPTIRLSKPIVGTGVESRVISDVGHGLQAKKSGFISYVDGNKILIYSKHPKISPCAKLSLSSKHGLLRCRLNPNRPWSGGGSQKMSTLSSIPLTTVGKGLFKPFSISQLGDQLKIPKKSATCVAPRFEPLPEQTRGFTKSLLQSNQQLNAVGMGTFSQNKLPLHFLKPLEYPLNSYYRSNQDTYMTHRPIVHEGQWVEKGDILADSSTSKHGELALGKNLLVGYAPWEGYNFEDAVLINERLVFDDLYTSLHIERYEVEVRDTLFGLEQITNQIGNSSLQYDYLDEKGIAKLGTWVQENDILVGKLAPISQRKLSPYENLLYDIIKKERPTTKDTSLRVPKGVSGRVIHVEILERNSTSSSVVARTHKKKMSFDTVALGLHFLPGFNHEKTSLLNKTAKSNLRSLLEQTGGQRLKKLSKHQNFSTFSQSSKAKVKDFNPQLQSRLAPFLGSSVCKNKATRLLNVLNSQGWEAFSNPKSQKKFELYRGHYLKPLLSKSILLDRQGKKRIQPQNALKSYSFSFPQTKKQGNPLSENLVASPLKIHIYLAEKRKLQLGDKIAGRHGNKGIISNILARQDMPYLPDGTPLDIVLNPLGVPSRMNVGQIFECLLGLAGYYLKQNYKIQPFDEIYGCEASRSLVYSKLYEARTKTKQNWLFNPNFPGKVRLFDGRTGESFSQPVTIGFAYILKLVHLVDDKIHARSTGPYSLVTQQPLRGRSKQGGQRVGEMEVWALEGFGAAYILQEILTIKSDDLDGRNQIINAILTNKPMRFGIPESFKVLVRELQSLCLDIVIFKVGTRKPIKLNIGKLN